MKFWHQKITSKLKDYVINSSNFHVGNKQIHKHDGNGLLLVVIGFFPCIPSAPYFKKM